MSTGDAPEITAGDGRLTAWFGEPGEQPMSETYRLTQAIAHGDESAFEKLHERHSLRLYRQLLGMTRGDEREAQEICHQTMMKVARRCEIIESEDELGAWLYRVAKNTFLDHRRQQQRDRKIVDLAEEHSRNDNRRSPDELGDAMSRAMRDLPPEEAELLNAVYVDGHTIANMAAQHGQTYKAMESRLTRLRRKVKERMLKLMRDEDRT